MLKGRNNLNLEFKFWRVPNRTIERNTVTYSNLVVGPEESTRRSRVAVALRIVPEEFPRPAVSVIINALSQMGETGRLEVPGRYSELVFPVLQQLRSARLLGESLVASDASACSVKAGQFALDSIRSIDKSLRATGVYELSQLEVLESDPAIMGEVCLVLGEVSWRLRNLARNIHLRLEKHGGVDDLARVADLIAMLSAKPKAETIH